MSHLGRTLIAVLLLTSLAVAQEQQCWTVVAPPFNCPAQGWLPGMGQVFTAPPNWAPPLPLKIVRAHLYYLAAVHPTDGTLDMGIDPGSVFTRTSGFPASQDGSFDRLAMLGHVITAPGQPRMDTQIFNTPIVWNPGDSLIAAWSCIGGVFVNPVWGICWVKP